MHLRVHQMLKFNFLATLGGFDIASLRQCKELHPCPPAAHLLRPITSPVPGFKLSLQGGTVFAGERRHPLPQSPFALPLTELFNPCKRVRPGNPDGQSDSEPLCCVDARPVTIVPLPQPLMHIQTCGTLNLGAKNYPGKCQF